MGVTTLRGCVKVQGHLVINQLVRMTNAYYNDWHQQLKQCRNANDDCQLGV